MKIEVEDQTKLDEYYYKYKTNLYEKIAQIQDWISKIEKESNIPKNSLTNMNEVIENNNKFLELIDECDCSNHVLYTIVELEEMCQYISNIINELNKSALIIMKDEFDSIVVKMMETYIQLMYSELHESAKITQDDIKNYLHTIIKLNTVKPDFAS